MRRNKKQKTKNTFEEWNMRSLRDTFRQTENRYDLSKTNYCIVFWCSGLEV